MHYDKVRYAISIPCPINSLKADYFVQKILEKLNELEIDYDIYDSFEGAFGLHQDFLQFEMENCMTSFSAVIPRDDNNDTPGDDYMDLEWVKLLFDPAIHGALIIRVQRWNPKTKSWQLHK